MNLEKLNLVELNAQEVEIIDGGNWIVRGFTYLAELYVGSAVEGAINSAVNNALTPQQAADYYKYRGM